MFEKQKFQTFRKHDKVMDSHHLFLVVMLYIGGKQKIEKVYEDEIRHCSHHNSHQSH